MKEHDSVTRKFSALRERAHLTLEELAQAMGYAGPSSIQRYENADNYKKEFLAPEIVLKLIKAVAGRGEPPIEPAEVWELAMPEVRKSQRGLIDTYSPEDDEQEGDQGQAYMREQWKPRVQGALPELDARLGAGEGVVGEMINLAVGNGNFPGHRVLAEWLIPIPYLRNEAKASPNDTIVMEIIGDSMQPTYLPGDRVLVDLSQDRMISDTVYAISDGFTEPQIKRLQRIPFSNPATVKIISDNPALETFTVELDRLKIIGRICGHIARK